MGCSGRFGQCGPEAGMFFGPTVAEIATPLEELPEGANEALLRSARALAKAR